MNRNVSNENASYRWNERAVGGQRSSADPGSKEYFDDIRKYRYGYETPFIKRLLLDNLSGKKLLEIGVGNGIDAVEICKSGAGYVGIDITENHLKLTAANLRLNGFEDFNLIKNDLLDEELNQKFDVVYSFGVLHHIFHEKEQLSRVHSLLSEDGELRVALYSKYSFFNAYLFFTWIFRSERSVSFNSWQGHVSDAASFERPIEIKIRSKKEILELYRSSGFVLYQYHKRGFVNNYIPYFGRFLEPDGCVLNLLGSILGWYHVMIFRKKKDVNFVVCQH